MSAKFNDGGPAFPASPSHYGMTLRDWFAGQAIGFITQQPLARNNATHASTARDAYAYADAMLAEREKGAHVR